MRRSGPGRPCSLDLRLGETAYGIRCSFLTGAEVVESYQQQNEALGKHFLRRSKGASTGSSE